MPVVEQFGIYHDPAKLASTMGMRELSDADARREGLRPCSECFPAEERQASVPNLRKSPNVTL